MKKDDIAENVLKHGKEGVKQNIIEALDEFCDDFAEEMWEAAEEIITLRKENAALRERLEKAVELPVPLGAFAICIRKISVWDGVPPKKHFKWVLAEELFTIDDIPNTGRLWFPNTEEGRKQAEERLKELQGE